MRYVLVMLIFIASSGVQAEVYRRVDAQGNVEFTDKPGDDAERVELQETTIIPGAPVRSADDEPAPEPSVEAYAPYESISVMAPADEETLRNQFSVGVDVVTVPALLTSLGHRVQLYVDGQPFGSPSGSPHFTLSDVNRGSHQLAAAVIGRDGEELIRSATTTFYLHKTSVANPRTGQTGGVRPPASGAR